jgi:CSLREA domain-containing protein
MQLVCLTSAVAAAVVVGVPVPSGAAALFVVDTTADTVDAVPGDGICEDSGGACSLRAAVQEANAVAGADSITLPPGAFVLTIPGAGEDAAATGDLDVTGDVLIAGVHNETTVDAGGLDRAVDLVGANLEIHDLIITGGAQVAPDLGGLGGGIRSTGGALSLYSGRVEGNAGELAGGIHALGGSLVLDEMTVSGNTGGYSGGIHANGVTTTINYSRVLGNVSTGGGAGGIDLLGSAGTTTIASSTIRGNSGDVGGIAAYNAGMTMTRSTIDANVGVGGFLAGGVLALHDAGPEPTVSMTNATISDNTGRGILTAGTRVQLDSLTVVGNTGVGIDAYWPDMGIAAEVELHNSVVAGNTPDCDTIGSPQSIASQGNNVASDTSCHFEDASDRESTDPMLAPVSDAEGGTAVAVPMPGSPLIDTSTACPVEDQLSMVRPADGDGNGVAKCDVGAVEVAEPHPSFGDVPIGHPFFVDVEWAVSKGLLVGYEDGSFGPSIVASRQGGVTSLWRRAGLPTGMPDPGFTDVATSHPFAEPIAWAAFHDVTQGYADDTFRPSAPLTRQTFVTWLWRAAGSPPGAPDPEFSDVPSSHPFADAIWWAADAGVVGGFVDGTFRPSKPTSRQVIAAMLHRHLAAVI